MMTQQYSPLALANEFIVLSGQDGAEHMKLQKLVYIAHGWWLSVNDDPILNEQPQVWRHGPVFPTLYHVMKEHGGARIRHPKSALFNREPDRVKDNDDVCRLINWVWAKYHRMTGFMLSDLTHEEGSPWQLTAARYDYKVPRNTPIPNETIKAHYKRLAQELSGEALG